MGRFFLVLLLLLASGFPASAAYYPPASGSAGRVLLSTVNASDSATVDLETTFNSTYDAYEIVVSGLTIQTNAQGIWIRLKMGGSYLSADYAYHGQREQVNSGTAVGSAATSAAQILVVPTATNAAADATDLVVHLSSPTSTTLEKAVFWTGRSNVSGSARAAVNGFGVQTVSTAALTGVRFMAASGNIVAGTFSLYGLRK